jgi:glycosyltransferase involved in cell wall biosynthesis
MRRYALTQHEFLLVPGGLSYRKNAPLIAAAWTLIRNRIPNLQLVVFGQSDPFWKGRLEAIDNSVRILGYLDDDEIRALFGAAAAVWFPSRYEGFGIPVLESMACGTPVVASNASALPEVAGDAAVLVSPMDPEGHAEAIVELCVKPSKHEEYVQRGFRHATKFRANTVVKQFGDLIHELS